MEKHPLTHLFCFEPWLHLFEGLNIMLDAVHRINGSVT